MNQAGFEQEFDEGILNMNDIWKLEGTGNATIKDGRLVLQEEPDGIGVVLWTREDWPSDMELSFDVSFSNNRGIGVFFFAARGSKGEDLFETPSKRTGDYEEYIHGDINAYSASFHRYWPTGENNPGANLRRNAGFNLLHAAEADPMLEAERTYHVLIRKEGAAIRIAVDGQVVHDYVDEDPLGSGKVGFRLRGDASCRMAIDNVRIRGI
jgi:hypothetical protein